MAIPPWLETASKGIGALSGAVGGWIGLDGQVMTPGTANKRAYPESAIPINPYARTSTGTPIIGKGGPALFSTQNVVLMAVAGALVLVLVLKK